MRVVTYLDDKDGKAFNALALKQGLSHAAMMRVILKQALAKGQGK